MEQGYNPSPNVGWGDALDWLRIQLHGAQMAAKADAAAAAGPAEPPTEVGPSINGEIIDMKDFPYEDL
jgi:hypothetical protein